MSNPKADTNFNSLESPPNNTAVKQATDAINRHATSIAVIETKVDIIEQDIKRVEQDIKSIQSTVDKAVGSVNTIKWLLGGGILLYIIEIPWDKIFT